VRLKLKGVELAGVYIIFLFIKGELYLAVYVSCGAGVVSVKHRTYPPCGYISPINVYEFQILKIDALKVYRTVWVTDVKVVDDEVVGSEATV